MRSPEDIRSDPHDIQEILRKILKAKIGGGTANIFPGGGKIGSGRGGIEEDAGSSC